MHIQFNDLFLLMQEQLDGIKVVPNPDILIELINRIRPSDSHNLEESQNKFDALIQALLTTPNASSAFQGYLLKLVNHYKQAGLYADSGILSLDGFWNQLGQRIGAHFLPLLTDESDLKDLVGKVFHQRSDKYWLENISEKKWEQLFRLLNQGHRYKNDKLGIKRDIVKAITVLSYRISGIGLYPEFINAYPELQEYESPFLVQNREIVEFIEAYKKQHRDEDEFAVGIPPDADQALVMIEQCRDVVQKIRRAIKRIG